MAIRSIAIPYYADPSNGKGDIPSFPAALERALELYNAEPNHLKQLKEIKDVQTTKYTELEMTDIIGGFCVLIYEA